MKKKLTIDEQITYMKYTKNISFKNKEEEKEAKFFLQNSTYFFKLKSYAKLFDKNKKDGKYWKLDYTQLVELSKIDLYLRRILFKMCLTIEHQLKLNLLNDISENSEEDGYDIVKCFFLKYPNVFESVKSKVSQTKDDYSSAILKKSYPNIPVWSLIETLSFKNFINIYEFYYSNNATKENKRYTKQIEHFLWSVRIIRNACAHNSCILNSLKRKNEELNFQLLTELSLLSIKLTDAQKDKLKYCVVNDIVVIIILYNKIVTSDKIKENCMSELKQLFDIRMVREKDIFIYRKSDNRFIIQSYRLVKSIIDRLNEQLYNTGDDQK